MSELIWLDSYSGQTVEQLLALEKTHRIDSLLVAFDQAIQQKTASLNDEERIVFVIERLETEFNNGGYHQFFLNTPDAAPDIGQALRRIGCTHTAAITEKAIQALRVSKLTAEQIERIIHEDDSARDALLAKCDEEFFKTSEDIAEHLFAFIKANKDRILS